MGTDEEARSRKSRHHYGVLPRGKVYSLHDDACRTESKGEVWEACIICNRQIYYN